jgi:outer membrane protein TolC
MKWNFILLLLTAALAAAADRPDLPANLTLNEALAIALTKSAVIRDAVAALDQASGRYTRSRSPLLPHVNIALRQNLQTTDLIGLGISDHSKGN